MIKKIIVNERKSERLTNGINEWWANEWLNELLVDLKWY